MKTIRISIDEPLLRALDRDPEVRRHGRSAVIRRALVEHLRRKRREAIAAAYRRAYVAQPPTELEGWSEEGASPDE